jgi:hypothetical protein
MTKRASEETKQHWITNIQNQRASGFSIERWCKMNNIAMHAFHYWQKKFFPKAAIDRSAFIEIQDEKKECDSLISAGIVIEFQGIYIHLKRQFDPSTLKQCLKIVREVTC